MSLLPYSSNKEYYDLFDYYDYCTIFHASNGYCARGYGKNKILFEYRRQFGDICGYWV